MPRRTVGCSMVGVGYSILLGISLITGEYGINAYNVMNLIEAGTPVRNGILFSCSGIQPQVTDRYWDPLAKKQQQQQQQQRQRNNHSLLHHSRLTGFADVKPVNLWS